LAKAERNKRKVPRFAGEKRDRSLGGIHAHPFLKRVFRVQKVLVGNVDFVPAPAEIISEIAS
jgi:hypothetical protein